MIKRKDYIHNDAKNMKQYLEENTKNISYTINVHEDETRNINVRIKPWCNINPVRDKKDEIRRKLRKFGVNPTEQNNHFILGSISQCMLALKFLDPPTWWRKVIYMMEEGKHTEKDGIVAIIQKRNEEMDSPKERKWTKEKVIEVISES